MIPLGTELDRIDATPSKLGRELAWDEDARELLERLVDREPVLVRISAAKRLRDGAESAARRAGQSRVARDTLAALAPALEDEPA